MGATSLHQCIFTIIVFINLAAASVDTSRQYLAILHHTPDEGYIAKRNVQNEQFVGNLIINNTLNDNGEVTISLCDITKDLFGPVNAYTLFDQEASGGIGSIVTAEVRASMKVKVNVDGCLQFFFNPCCGTIGVRIVLDDPVTLSATGSIDVHMEAFSFGTSAGTRNIDINPLNGFNLGGFSPVLGSWGLPPILDEFTNTKMTNKKFCAGLNLPLDITRGLNFCVELNNFTAGLHGVNVCPRLTIQFGTQTLLNVSYRSVVGGGEECLGLSFIPQCSQNGEVILPTIIDLFKSIDSDSNFKLDVPEFDKLKALLGIYGTEKSNVASFAKMDQNGDGEVNFTEFQTYTTVQNQTYSETPYVKEDSKTTFNGGDIALAVIMTMLATGLVVAACLIAFAQYKGLIKNPWLAKVIPTKV